MNKYVKGYWKKNLMSTEEKRITYESTVRFANLSTRRHAKRLWIASHIGLSKSLRELSFLCHTYLRWIDDFIDFSEQPLNIKKHFLNNETIYVEQVENGIIVTPNSLQEACLFYFIKKARELKMTGLIKSLRMMFSSFTFDLERMESGNLMTQIQQEEYTKRIHKGMFDFIQQLILKTQPTNNHFVGPFYWHANSIRDLKEDLQFGIINLTKEESEKFKINPSGLLTDPNFSCFIKYKVELINNLLLKEAEILYSMPMIIKIFWISGYSPIIIKMNRITLYDYQLSGTHGISPLIEAKMLINSFIKIFKLYYKVFFNIKTQLD